MHFSDVYTWLIGIDLLQSRQSSIIKYSVLYIEMTCYKIIKYYADIHTYLDLMIIHNHTCICLSVTRGYSDTNNGKRNMMPILRTYIY